MTMEYCDHSGDIKWNKTDVLTIIQNYCMEFI